MMLPTSFSPEMIKALDERRATLLAHPDVIAPLTRNNMDTQET
jgi:hypothetical protein